MGRCAARRFLQQSGMKKPGFASYRRSIFAVVNKWFRLVWSSCRQPVIDLREEGSRILFCVIETARPPVKLDFVAEPGSVCRIVRIENEKRGTPAAFLVLQRRAGKSRFLRPCRCLSAMC
jgi:hypothetical protein